MQPFFGENVENNKPLNNKITDLITHLAEQPQGLVYRNEQKVQNQTQTTTASNTKKQQLELLYSTYVACKSCPLATQGRTQVVFGQGNPDTQLMFVGEGPGKDEDEQGYPFVGRAGQLLTKIIQAMGLQRSDVYISNVVKCRPPQNRVPLPTESNVCKQLILNKEIEIIQPRIICTLGATATQALLGEDIKITRARGQFFTAREGVVLRQGSGCAGTNGPLNNILILPTYHPAYLLRNPAEKRTVWEDMKKIMEKLQTLKSPGA